MVHCHLLAPPADAIVRQEIAQSEIRDIPMSLAMSLAWMAERQTQHECALSGQGLQCLTISTLASNFTHAQKETASGHSG